MTRHQFRAIVGLAYLLLLVAVILGLFRARRWALSVYGAPAAQSQWDSFRDDVDRQRNDEGPVKRRVPRSAEPPALVLMRDYFVVCVSIAVVLCSALFATFALFIGGMICREGNNSDRV